MPEYPPPIAQGDFLDPVEAADAPPRRRLFALRTPNNRGVGNVVAQAVVAVEELKVTSSRTGRSSQKSFAEALTAAIRSASREKRFCFVPEEEVLSVAWKIKGAEHVRELVLEVFRRAELQPLFTKKLRFDPGRCPAKGSTTFSGDLSATMLVHGDGYRTDLRSNFAKAEFPDEVLTVEHSPYKLKLTISAQGNTLRTTPARWVFLDVLLDGLELAWLPKTTLAVSPTLPTNTGAPVERDHQVYDSVTDQTDANNLSGKLPTPGQTKKVYLRSNIFYRAEAELTENHAWSQHHAVWGEGPNLPLGLTVGVRRSDGQRVTGAAAGRALGATKFVWQWIDAAKDPDPAPYDILPSSRHTPDVCANGQTVAVDFVTKAIDFDRATTAPKGRNCHVERGGKRGPGAAAVFPTQNGTGAFPFVVQHPVAGNWCATSKALRSGARAGQTAVVFQPSIQPGDRYALRVAAVYGGYVDPTAGYDAFDTAMTALPAGLKLDTGVFEVWKTVDHLLLSSVPNGLQDPHVASVAKRFAKQFIRVVTVRRSVAQYTTALNGIYNNTGPSAGALEGFVRLALDGAHHVDPSRGAWFKSWDDWRTALVQQHGSAVAAAAWGDAYVHPTRSFWRGSQDARPFALPWPTNIVFHDAVGTTEVRGTFSGGHQGAVVTVKNFQVAAVGALKASLKSAFNGFWVDANGPFFTGDAAIDFDVTCPNGDRAAVTLAITEAIREATDEKCKSVYDYALGYAWGFRVMELALQDMLGTDDGLITVQFDKPMSGMGPAPAAKAYFATPSRASIFIFMLKTDEMEGTLCHEFGHAMFLNHQFYEPAGGVANDPRQLHDETDPKHCTMSTPAAQRNYCGFCMLRLRAWSIYELDAVRVPVPIVPAPIPPVADMSVRTLTKTPAANTR